MRCHEKIRLPSLVGALAALQAALRFGPRRLYKCDRCEWWHLTSLRHDIELVMIEAHARTILKPGWSVGDTDPSEFDLDELLPIRHRAA